MKTTIPITCGCGHAMTFEVSGTDDPKDTQCPKCDVALWFVKPLGDFVGQRILSRGYVELKDEDFTLVIVLSAMAVECELARLFIKWNEIDKMDVSYPTEADRETWAEQWRKWSSISVRLDKVAKLLVNSDFDSFLVGHAEVLKDLHSRFPALQQVGVSHKDFVVRELFHRRNKIVHLGKIDFKQPDGEAAFTVAVWLFTALKRMDDIRISVLDAKHSAQQHTGPPKP
jgi:hypothetical protein